MIGSRSNIVILAVSLMLTACKGTESSTNGRENSSGTSMPIEGDINVSGPSNGTVPTTAISPVADPRSPDGAGAQPGLRPLSQADMGDAALSGELRCSFMSQAGAATMLVAAGDVGTKVPAEAIVAAGGTVMRVSQPGGFNAMLKGATFTGEGAKVRIALTGPAKGGGESPARPGTLHYERDGRELAEVRGDWVCGP
jgi:hypothetical protein